MRRKRRISIKTNGTYRVWPKKLSDYNKHFTSESWPHSIMLMSFCIILDFNYFSLPPTAHSDLAGNSCSHLFELKMDKAFAP